MQSYDKEKCQQSFSNKRLPQKIDNKNPLTHFERCCFCCVVVVIVVATTTKADLGRVIYWWKKSYLSLFVSLLDENILSPFSLIFLDQVQKIN